MSNIEQKIEYLPTDCIFPHPQNPRKDLGDLTELADSIRQNGILQNLTVVEDGDTYTVLIGHRRLAAAKLAGLEKVPCVVASMSGKEQIQTMMVENMQRSDLTPYEQAQGFQLMFDLGDSIEDVSKSTGFSEATIRRRTKLLELDQKKFQAAQERGATLSDYAELDKVSDLKAKNRLLDKIGSNNFRNALEREMAEERKKALKAYYIAEISKFAKEYTGDDIYKDYQWKTRFMLFGKKEEIIPPVDATTTEYVYRADNYAVSLFAKKTDASSTKCIDAFKAEQEERRQRREKEENRLNALKEAATRAVSLRRGFVETVGVRAIRANMKKIVAALVFLVFDDTFEIQYLRQQ